MSGEPTGTSGDDPLVDELRRLVERVDPVPESVLAAARGSFTWRTIDAELAEVAYDSALAAEGAALVRGAGARRVLTFESPALSIELEVTGTGDGRRLVGQLAPAGRAEIEVRHPGGVVTVEADDLGRFAADVAHGPVSLVCRAGEATVATDWLVL